MVLIVMIGIILSYINMSHYTFTFIPEVYRWLVAENLLPNTGLFLLIQDKPTKDN